VLYIFGNLSARRKYLLRGKFWLHFLGLEEKIPKKVGNFSTQKVSKLGENIMIRNLKKKV
jgi:hypothetical protein